MSILNFRTSTYARNIYIYGSERLTARDGFGGVSRTPDDYYTPTQKYAASGLVNGVAYPVGFTGYTRAQIDNALAKGWINQTEYDETIAYIPV